jgi:hypothetical protein
MIKKFKYQDYSNYNNIKLSTNKYNVSYFNNIKYEGFEFIIKRQNYFEFSIECKIIRKLKLNKINRKISNINELKILQLLNRSKEILDSEFLSGGGLSRFRINRNYWYKKEINLYEIEQRKNQVKYFNNKNRKK